MIIHPCRIYHIVRLVATLIATTHLCATGEAEGIVVDVVHGAIAGQEYQFTLLLCDDEPDPDCELDSQRGTKPFLVRAQKVSENGDPVGESIALVRIPEVPLSRRLGQPHPERDCTLAWDAERSTLWAVSAAVPQDSLFLMVLPVAVAWVDATQSLSVSVPDVCVASQSVSADVLTAAGALPQIDSVAISDHTVVIRLASRDPDRESDRLPDMVFDPESGEWVDEQLDEPDTPADEEPSTTSPVDPHPPSSEPQ